MNITLLVTKCLCELYIFNFFSFISSDIKSLEKDIHPKPAIRRRNTLDTIIFNEMCDKADKDWEDEAKEDVKEGSRKCKRSLKLLRGNERDLKLDVEAAYNYAGKHENVAPSTPNQMKVCEETRKRLYSSSNIFLQLHYRITYIFCESRNVYFLTD